MPRPRKATDQEIFAAAQRVMSRVGATQLRLSDIAAEAGITAGALVQRFGSKRGLLLRLATGIAEWTGQFLAELRAAHTSPLAALRAYADCVAQMGESPGGLAHHLGYLQIDLGDPEFQPHMRRHAQVARAGIQRMLEDAVAHGELRRGTKPVSLARTVEAVIGGSLFAWAFHRKGRPREWVRHDLDAVLRPYLARRRP